MIHGSGPVMRGYGQYGQGLMANGQNGWMGLIPLVFHLIFLIGIIILVVIVYRRHGSKVRSMQKLNDPALLILRERYALGGIDTVEFNSRKQDLSPNPPAVKK